MNKNAEIQIAMLAAELQRSVCYMAQDPEAVKDISSTIMDWAGAENDQDRSDIYRTWRNKQNT